MPLGARNYGSQRAVWQVTSAGGNSVTKARFHSAIPQSERGIMGREDGEVMRPEEERGMELFSMDRERLQGEGGDLAEEKRGVCEEEEEEEEEEGVDAKERVSLEEKDATGAAEREEGISTDRQRDRGRRRER